MKSLKNLHFYHFYVYGYDAHGHSRGYYAVGALVRATGFFVTGFGRIAGLVGGDMALDRHGEVHVVGVDSQAAGDPVVYLTRKHGAKRWTRQVVPNSTEIADGRDVGASVANGTAIHLSPNGKRVVVDAHGCKGDYSASASITSRRLPRLHLAAEADICFHGDSGSEGFGYVDSAALPHDKDVAIGQDPYNNAFDVVVGQPGHAYTQQVLSDTTGADPLAVTCDPVTGEITILGVRYSGAQPGIFAWSRVPGQAWSGPVLVDSDLSSAEVTLTSFNGTAYLALEVAPTAHLLTRTPGGQWSKPKP